MDTMKREEEESQSSPAVVEMRRETGSEEDSDYEDEQIKHLEEKGGQNYFGSQSILSQEIHAAGGGFSQGTAAGTTSVAEDEDPMVGLSQVSMSTSVTIDSQQMVAQYLLLSQDPAARSARVIDISTTTGGSSQGGFGTLLDAVSIFQSQELEEEEEKARIFSDEAMRRDRVVFDSLVKRSSNWPTLGQEDSQFSSTKHVNSQPKSVTAASSQRKRKQTNTTGDESKNKKEKTCRTTTSSAAKKPHSVPKKNNSTDIAAPPCSRKKVPTDDDSKKRKGKDDADQQQQQQLANRAADLAQRTINEPELAKRLLLSMALTRENPRSAPETLPGPGHVLPEGFFWAHYPPLEKVLKDNMAEYYELSITKCQSAQQQSFNNTLVDLIRAETTRQKWVYADSFTDKILRDRIRCYYKTHIQNAKKRLRTMIKNPTKKANAKHLCAHLDMIEKTVEKKTISPTSNGDLETSDVITHKDWGSGFAGPEKQGQVVDNDAYAPENHMQVCSGEVSTASFCREAPGSSHDNPTRPAGATSSPPEPATSAPTPIRQSGTSSGPPMVPHPNSAHALQPQCSAHPLPPHHARAQSDPHHIPAPLPDEAYTVPLTVPVPVGAYPLPHHHSSHCSDSGYSAPPPGAKSSNASEQAASVPATVETLAAATGLTPTPTAAPSSGYTRPATPKTSILKNEPASPNLPPVDLPSRTPTTGTASLVSVDSNVNANLKKEDASLFV